MTLVRLFTRLSFASALATVAMGFAPSTVVACGPDTDCMIGERTYRIRMPQGHDGKSKVGAIIFNHGYRGTAAGLMKNKNLSRAISRMGLAFVAPKSAREDWDIPNAPSPGPRVEIPFFDKLKQDLVDQHGIDGNRLMVSGFSAGGMMTWNLACERGGNFAAFAPIAGTFWAPVPDKCERLPANIIHIHGTSDRIVPIEGRAIASTRQGNVNTALDLAAKAGGYGNWKATSGAEGLDCKMREGGDGKVLQLCLHPGGHSFRAKWLERAWKQFEQAGAFGG